MYGKLQVYGASKFSSIRLFTSSSR